MTDGSPRQLSLPAGPPEPGAPVGHETALRRCELHRRLGMARLFFDAGGDGGSGVAGDGSGGTRTDSASPVD